MKKVIIIGASTGIGKALAIEMGRKGYVLGITARRLELLQELKTQIGGEVFVKKMDVSQFQAARTQLAELVDEMGGLDILILNAGIGDGKPEWEQEMKIIDINAKGFVALGAWGYEYFRKQGKGHLVGTSSIMAERGFAIATVYAATKVFISSYLEGLRIRTKRSRKKNIHITDIRPGFIDTPLNEGNAKMAWPVTAEVCAKGMLKAIERKQKVAYIPFKWWWISRIIKWAPEWLMAKF